MNKVIVKYLKYRWKKLGYKFRFSSPENDFIILSCINLNNPACPYSIKIDLHFKEFWKCFDDGDLKFFTFEENLLITETFSFLCNFKKN